MDDKKQNEDYLFSILLQRNNSYDRDMLNKICNYYSNLFDFVPNHNESVEYVKSILENLFYNYNFNTKTNKNKVLYPTLNNDLKELARKTVYYFESFLRQQKVLTEEDEDRLFNFFNQEQHFYLLGKIIFNNLANKVIYKYRHLLPTRISNTFKESYVWIYNSLKTYETFQANKEAEEKYIQIHNNEGISDVIKHLGLNKVTDERIEKFQKYGEIEAKYITPKGNEFKFNIDNNECSSIFQISDAMNDLGKPQQALLIIYIMSLAFEQAKDGKIENSTNITIDVKKYCELRDIDYRSDTVDSIHEDIKNLQRIIVKYKYKDTNGKEIILRESPLVSPRGILNIKDNGIMTDKQFIKVNIGAWMETLNYKQFQHINKDFFKYDLRKVNNAIVPISYYINTQHRNNLKKRTKKIGLKVNNLTSKLGVKEDRVKAKGYSSTLKKPLEKILNEIQKTEGFKWSYKNGNHTSRKEFEEDVIIFKNDDLDDYYNSIGYEKKETKKSKNKK